MFGGKARSVVIGLFVVSGAVAGAVLSCSQPVSGGEQSAAAGVRRLAGGTARVKFDANVFGSTTNIRSIRGELTNALETDAAIDAVVLDLAPVNDVGNELDAGCRVSFAGVILGTGAESPVADSAPMDGSARTVAKLPGLGPGQSMDFALRGIDVTGPCAWVELRITPLVTSRTDTATGVAIALGRFEFETTERTVDSEALVHGADRFVVSVRNVDAARSIRVLRGALLAEDGGIASVLTASLRSDAEPSTAIPATARFDANGFELRDVSLAAGSACELVVEFKDRVESDGVLRLQVHAEFD